MGREGTVGGENTHGGWEGGITFEKVGDVWAPVGGQGIVFKET